MSWIRSLAFAAFVLALLATPRPAHALAPAAHACVAQDEEPSEPSAADELLPIPDDEAVARGSDTPRNAAFTFIVLSRDGDWVDAADMLERPAAGWPEGVPATRIARSLKSILDHRLWLNFPSLPGIAANAPGAPTRVTVGVVDTPETVLEVEMIRVDDRWIFAANTCLLYTSPSPRDRQKARMPSSA